MFLTALGIDDLKECWGSRVSLIKTEVHLEAGSTLVKLVLDSGLSSVTLQAENALLCSGSSFILDERLSLRHSVQNCMNEALQLLFHFTSFNRFHSSIAAKICVAALQ